MEFNRALILEKEKKENKLRKQSRITVYDLGQPAALFFSLYLCVFTPHAGKKSSHWGTVIWILEARSVRTRQTGSL